MVNARFACWSGWIRIYLGLVWVSIFRKEDIASVWYRFLWFCRGGIDWDVDRMWRGGLQSFRRYWFVHAYVILMAFAPLVNLVCERAVAAGNRASAVRMLMPVIALVFCWSFLAEIRYVKWLMPMSNGVTQLSGYTLIGIYCVARITRLYEQELRVVTWQWFPVAVISASFCAVGHFGFYDSPVMLIFASSLFFIFKRIKISAGSRVTGFINLILPSVFAVYTIHTNLPALTWMVEFDQRWYSILGEYIGGVGMALFTGVFVFVLSVFLDLPRRLLVSGIKRIGKVAK